MFKHQCEATHTVASVAARARVMSAVTVHPALRYVPSYQRCHQCIDLGTHLSMHLWFCAGTGYFLVDATASPYAEPHRRWHTISLSDVAESDGTDLPISVLTAHERLMTRWAGEVSQAVTLSVFEDAPVEGMRVRTTGEPWNGFVVPVLTRQEVVDVLVPYLRSLDPEREYIGEVSFTEDGVIVSHRIGGAEDGITVWPWSHGRLECSGWSWVVVT